MATKNYQIKGDKLFNHRGEFIKKLDRHDKIALELVIAITNGKCLIKSISKATDRQK